VECVKDAAAISNYKGEEENSKSSAELTGKRNYIQGRIESDVGTPASRERKPTT